ncbi:hypothetical protein L9F63_006607, partial [Diploptera punctata]
KSTNYFTRLLTPSKLSKKLLALCRLKLNSFSYACTLYGVTISELVNFYIADVRKYPADCTISLSRVPRVNVQFVNTENKEEEIIHFLN